MPDKDTLSLEIELLELEHKRIQLDMKLWHKRHEILTAKAAKPYSSLQSTILPVDKSVFADQNLTKQTAVEKSPSIRQTQPDQSSFFIAGNEASELPPIVNNARPTRKRSPSSSLIDSRPHQQRRVDENYEVEDGESPRSDILSATEALAKSRQAKRAPRPEPRTARDLDPTQRRKIEQLFCMKLAFLIGSKECVAMPPQPADDVTIFERLKIRMKGWFDESETGYKSVTDFRIDVESLLRNYSKLGHCERCPFLRNGGNPRIMCYRMRLWSIVDTRLRELKSCLEFCAANFDPADTVGMCNFVTNDWFSKEDFEPDNHHNDR